MHCKGMQNAQQCDINYKIENFCKKYKSTMQKYMIARGCKSTAYCTAKQAAVKAAPLLPRQLSPRCSGCRAFNSRCTKRGKEEEEWECKKLPSVLLSSPLVCKECSAFCSMVSLTPFMQRFLPHKVSPFTRDFSTMCRIFSAEFVVKWYFLAQIIPPTNITTKSVQKGLILAKKRPEVATWRCGGGWKTG